MLVIPAIDVKDGQCVRLRQGDLSQSTIYADDPVEMVSRWKDVGARRLHVVDLDGAVAGNPRNRDVIARMVDAAAPMPVQIGGGIRDHAVASRYIDLGVRYVIVGTKAVETPSFVAELCQRHPDQIIVGLDSRSGRVATDGWVSDSGRDVIACARQFAQFGVSAIIHTDIARDGMLHGVNMASTVALAAAASVPVYASGGVADLADIRTVAEGLASGVVGVIVGRALYEGSLDFADAQRLADRLDGANGSSGT